MSYYAKTIRPILRDCGLTKSDTALIASSKLSRFLPYHLDYKTQDKILAHLNKFWDVEKHGLDSSCSTDPIPGNIIIGSGGRKKIEAGGFHFDRCGHCGGRVWAGFSQCVFCDASVGVDDLDNSEFVDENEGEVDEMESRTAVDCFGSTHPITASGEELTDEELANGIIFKDEDGYVRESDLLREIGDMKKISSLVAR